jgi:hypothetical protein
MTLSIENIRVLPTPALELIGTSREHPELPKGSREKARELAEYLELGAGPLMEKHGSLNVPKFGPIQRESLCCKLQEF